jgi:hypothetical protein
VKLPSLHPARPADDDIINYAEFLTESELDHLLERLSQRGTSNGISEGLDGQDGG